MHASRGLFKAKTPLAWLPDETLFSLCSRYHLLSGNQLASTTCKTLFGHPSQGCAHDLPSRISFFSKLTGEILGSTEEIIRQRTLLPFYLPFCSPVTAANAISAVSGPSIGSLKFQLGLLTSRFRAHHPLKACLECMAEDLRRWSTAYWHLEHQLPGVWICRKHRKWLASSDLKASGVERFQWVLPCSANLRTDQPQYALTSSVTALAEASTDLASVHQQQHFDAKILKRTYRQALGTRGLLSGVNGERLNLQKIGSEYAEFVDAFHMIPELRALPATVKSASAEVGRLTYEYKGVTHPIRHLSLIAWLFPNFNMFIEAYGACQRSGHEVDVNPLTPKGVYHCPLHPKRGAFMELIASGEAISTAARSLGVDPVTGMAWAASSGVATKKRPSVLRFDIRIKIVAALEQGASKSNAAEIGGVSIVSITRLLRTEVGLLDKWRAARFDNAQRLARLNWQQITTANPWSGVKAARLLEPAAYAWLYRHDRTWLDEQVATLARGKAHGGLKVDWDLRDREMSLEVQRVGAELAVASPGRRIKLWQVYQRLPNLKAKLSKLDRLPLTRGSIQKLLSAYAGEDDLFMVKEGSVGR